MVKSEATYTCKKSDKLRFNLQLMSRCAWPVDSDISLNPSNCIRQFILNLSEQWMVCCYSCFQRSIFGRCIYLHARKSICVNRKGVGPGQMIRASGRGRQRCFQLFAYYFVCCNRRLTFSVVFCRHNQHTSRNIFLQRKKLFNVILH